VEQRQDPGKKLHELLVGLEEGFHEEVAVDHGLDELEVPEEGPRHVGIKAPLKSPRLISSPAAPLRFARITSLLCLLTSSSARIA